MRVTRLQLRDFRSYEQAELRPGPGLTVVAGRNGAGKTNLLEAIYFACTGPLVPDGQRARGRPLRRTAHAAGARGGGRARPPRGQRRVPARRGEAAARRRRAGRAPDGRCGAAARVGLPARPPRARARRAGAAARAPGPGRRGAVARPGRARGGRTRRRSASATR